MTCVAFIEAWILLPSAVTLTIPSTCSAGDPDWSLPLLFCDMQQRFQGVDSIRGKEQIRNQTGSCGTWCECTSCAPGGRHVWRWDIDGNSLCVELGQHCWYSDLMIKMICICMVKNESISWSGGKETSTIKYIISNPVFGYQELFRNWSLPDWNQKLWNETVWI